jgi:uncharacterized protein with NRDE domain
MCLIVFALNVHPELPLVVLANRDEYYARPTAQAQPFGDAPEIYGGRDLEKGGTWLAVHSAGRFAAVTNFRDPAAVRSGRSRGALVREALGPHPDPLSWAQGIARPLYPSFNLLLGDPREVLYAHDASEQVQRLSAGVHGLSNARLDDPWPKVRRACARLTQLLAAPTLDVEAAFAILADPTQAPDAELPHTGVPLALERTLSAAFIAMPGYGTRASTVLIAHRDGRWRFAERTFGEGGVALGATDVWLSGTVLLF